MELYELRQSTLELVDLLRKTGTIGPKNHERNNGKTTALLIFAKQIQDEGKNVIVATSMAHWMLNKWRQLFPASIQYPTFTSQPLHGIKRSSVVFIDEPNLLKWNDDDFDRLRAAVRVYAVGDWYA